MNTAGAVCLIAAVTRGFGERLLTTSPLRYLGKISYSLYLTHPVVLLLVGWLAIRSEWYGPGLGPHIAVLGFAVPCSIALATLFYRIERWGMDWGAVVAARVKGRAAVDAGGVRNGAMTEQTNKMIELLETASSTLRAEMPKAFTQELAAAVASIRAMIDRQEIRTSQEVVIEFRRRLVEPIIDQMMVNMMHDRRP